TSASDSKVSDSHKTNKTSSAGKLAFSLKPKSKLVEPAVKLSEDDEEDENNASGDEQIKRQKLDQNYVSHHDDVCSYQFRPRSLDNKKSVRVSTLYLRRKRNLLSEGRTVADSIADRLERPQSTSIS
nr:SURP and G-patch domain-containing protein 1-like protein [Tanacetum cinerariifolium]